MIKKPQYTFGRETSQSDLMNLRDHLKGRNNVSKTVNSTVHGYSLKHFVTLSSKTRDA